MRDLLPRLENKLKPTYVNHRKIYKQFLEEKRKQKKITTNDMQHAT